MGFTTIDGKGPDTILVGEGVKNIYYIIGPKEEGGHIGFAYDPGKAKQSNLELLRFLSHGVIEIDLIDKGRYEIWTTTAFQKGHKREFFKEIPIFDYDVRTSEEQNLYF